MLTRWRRQIELYAPPGSQCEIRDSREALAGFTGNFDRISPVRIHAGSLAARCGLRIEPDIIFGEENSAGYYEGQFPDGLAPAVDVKTNVNSTDASGLYAFRTQL